MKPWETPESVHDALGPAAARLAASGIPDARRSVQWLAADLLDLPTLMLPEDARFSLSQAERFRQGVERLCRGEPLHYVSGRAPFLDFSVQVSPAVLIPRPETEEMADLALGRLHGTERVADVGTGSGVLALAVLRAFPSCTVTAIDISAAALAVAQQNARDLGVAPHFLQNDLLSNQPDASFDVILANLPYVPDAEWETLSGTVRDHEPRLALRGGPDGLDLIRRLVAQAVEVLAPQGWILLETSTSQHQDVEALAVKAGFAFCSLTDLTRRPRFVLLHR